VEFLLFRAEFSQNDFESGRALRVVTATIVHQHTRAWEHAREDVVRNFFRAGPPPVLRIDIPQYRGVT
jgi:hypothetical protein